MKKLILTCALLTSASMLSFAQSTTTSATMSAQPTTATAQKPAMQHNQPTAEQMAERRAQIYKKQYSLDDKQYKGVYDAELVYMKQNMDLRAQGVQPTSGQAQQMMMAKDQKFKEAMSAEQYSKYMSTRSPQPNMPAPANK